MPRPRTILLALSALVLGGAVLAWLLVPGRGAASRGGEPSASSRARPVSPASDRSSQRSDGAITFLGGSDRSSGRPSGPRSGASSRAPVAPPRPPAPIRPGELPSFETVAYPLGRPAYAGEPVSAYVRVGSLGKDLALNVNQGGEFPRVPVAPGETVEIRLAFSRSAPGTRVALNAEDGGSLRVGRESGRSLAGALDGQRQLGLSYRVTTTSGAHRVTLRTPDGETKTLEFWSGDPPTRKTMP